MSGGEAEGEGGADVGRFLFDGEAGLGAGAATAHQQGTPRHSATTLAMTSAWL